MAEVQAVGFDGKAVSSVTPEIQRLLDLLQSTSPVPSDGLTMDEWAQQMGKGRDATRRIVKRLVEVGQMTVGFKPSVSITGVAVKSPVYALKQ